MPWASNQDSRAFRKSLIRLPEILENEGLTPWLTGAGSRRLEGTNISHENAEGMAYVGVRVEPIVRLGRVGTVFVLSVHRALLSVEKSSFDAYALQPKVAEVSTNGGEN